MNILSIPPRYKHYLRRESIGILIACAVVDMITVILQYGNRNADEVAFNQTRKEFFDEYTPAELRAMKQDEARRKFDHEEGGRFWSGA
jgi:hypothetical protein